MKKIGGEIGFIDERNGNQGICYSEWSLGRETNDKTMSFEDINKLRVQNYGEAYARYIKRDQSDFVPPSQPKLSQDNTYEI